LTDQACAILNYKSKAEEEKVLTIPYCKFEDVERQLDYVLLTGDDDNWFGDWETKKRNFKEYDSLSFGARDYVMAKKQPPLKFTGM